ncbi:hypothetical protein [Mariniluteicoccus flavus]
MARRSDGWWHRIVVRAEFRPDDTVLLGRGGDAKVQDFEHDGGWMRALYWTQIAFWLVFALPMAVGMPIVGLAAVGLRMPPFHASFGATALSYLWRIPLALFTLGLSGVLIWQWLTITAFLRFWRARRR